MKPYCIPQLAKPYTNYDMIQKHTDLPSFSDGRAHLLYIFLNHESSAKESAGELYTLVTALVQLGLDTHEDIDRSNDKQGKDPMRSRQLKVLAGDYFSSWFYHLLAKRNQIEMVGILSTAIADFNVLKANLYVQMRSVRFSAEQYLRQMTQMNMRLFHSFTPMLESSVIELWEKLLTEFSRCETIVSELQRSSQPKNARYGYSYWRVMEMGTEEERKQLQEQDLDQKDWKTLIMKYNCDSQLTDKLQDSIQSIQELLKSVKNDSLLKELKYALDRFITQMKVSGQAAVEG